MQGASMIAKQERSRLVFLVLYFASSGIGAWDPVSKRDGIFTLETRES